MFRLQWWDCKHKKIRQILVAAGGVTSEKLREEDRSRHIQRQMIKEEMMTVLSTELPERQMMRKEIETVLSTELAVEVRKVIEELLA